MPLRRGHIAMVLAAGLMDNMTVERDDQCLLVKGRLNKVQVDITDQKDRENHIKRTREQFKASITTLDLATGEIAVLDNEQALRTWLTEWQQDLAHKIVATFKPLHRMIYDGLPHFHTITDSHSRHRRLPGRSRTGLFEAQKQVTAALVRRYLSGADFAVLQATMGTGKTTIATSLADVLKKYLAPNKPFPVIVVCPPHLVEKWPREIEGVVPMARAMVVRRPGDLEAYVRDLNASHPTTLTVAVVSSEMLKLGSGWTPAVVRQRGRRLRLITDSMDGQDEQKTVRVDTFACPRCGQTIYDHDEAGRPTFPITDSNWFSRRRRQCENLVQVWVGDPSGDGGLGHWKQVVCGEPLYQQWRGKWPKPKRDSFGRLLPLPQVRYPIAEYIRRRYPNFFEWPSSTRYTR